MPYYKRHYKKLKPGDRFSFMDEHGKPYHKYYKVVKIKRTGDRVSVAYEDEYNYKIYYKSIAVSSKWCVMLYKEVDPRHRTKR